MSGNKLVVYTAIFGGYDKIRDPNVWKHSKHTDYWMVTEPLTEIYEHSKWSRFPMIGTAGNLISPRMRSRLFKLHPHTFFPDADITLWHGGNIQLNIDPQLAVDKWLGDADIAVFKHPHRNCVYAEARTCLEMGKGKREAIEAWTKYMQGYGYPKGVGLSACWFMIRRNNERMRRFNEHWWMRLVQSETERDQLCFNFADSMVRPAIKINYIPGNLLTSTYFKYHKHGSK